MNIETLLTADCLDVPYPDRTAIIDALYRFGAGQDLKDRALFESAFTSDATLDFTGPAAKLGATIPVFDGLSTISDTVLSTTAGLDTTHTISNPRITAFDGNHATLFALVEAQHLPRDDHSRQLLLKNIYAVDLVKDRERRWLITQMVIANVWMTGDARVLFG